MTIRARFDGQVFVPEEPVDLPAGIIVEIPCPPRQDAESQPTVLTRLLEILDQFPENPDWPEDGAAQHDHYLYGTPKRP